MIDRAMMRRLLTQCGMETMVIDDATMRLATAIFAAGAAEERDACAKIAELGDEGEWSKTTGDFDSCRGRDIAHAIRMRSNMKVTGA